MKKDTAKAICTQHAQALCPIILKDIVARARLGMMQEHCRIEGLTSFIVLNELCFQPSSCIAKRPCVSQVANYRCAHMAKLCNNVSCLVR